jgi:hypothetical protein
MAPISDSPPGYRSALEQEDWYRHALVAHLTTGPQIAVADGALGFWKALGEVWPIVDAAHAGDAGFAPENQVRTSQPVGAAVTVARSLPTRHH